MKLQYQITKHIQRVYHQVPRGLFLTALVLAAVVGPQCSAVPNPVEGKEAPSFSLKLMDGGTFDLSEHLGKRPVVLDFWAVWCPPCRAAIPKVASTRSSFADQDVIILTVNLGDSVEGIEAFLKSASVDVPVALDDSEIASELYHITSIPTMVFIDKEGKVARVNVGGMSEASLHSVITDLL
ncbi:MAG: TlpA family protein disulfide reductase [Candidatus Hydrogenedentes bacterium]|nr:TlpA family protein disulfide reductase [Candidatus Hydrogenedentota bacterium]